ncbi:hypothetical protein KJ684_01230 [Patescibacteria group bacterium]|nr:hypothetical protein [Patescibacteria group bacterium]
MMIIDLNSKKENNVEKIALGFVLIGFVFGFLYIFLTIKDIKKELKKIQEKFYEKDR